MQFDWIQIVVFGSIAAIVVALVVWQITSALKRKNMGKDLLATHPDAARIYTRLGGPTAGILKMSVGALADVSVNSINGKGCGFVLDSSGGFTPVLAGTHALRVTAIIKRPGFPDTIKVSDMEITLAPYQCLFVGYDKQQKIFYTQDVGYSYQMTPSA